MIASEIEFRRKIFKADSYTNAMICYLMIISVFMIFLVSYFILKTNHRTTDFAALDKLDFKLPSIIQTDKYIKSDELIGQKYILSFFSNNCKKCNSNYNYFEKLPKTDVPIYGILVEKDINPVKKNLRKLVNIYKDIAVDNRGIISDKLLLVGVPETFLINENGHIIKHVKGAINNETYYSEIVPFLTN